MKNEQFTELQHFVRNKIHEYNGERFAILMKTNPPQPIVRERWKAVELNEWERKKEGNKKK